MRRPRPFCAIACVLLAACSAPPDVVGRASGDASVDATDLVDGGTGDAGGGTADGGVDGGGRVGPDADAAADPCAGAVDLATVAGEIMPGLLEHIVSAPDGADRHHGTCSSTPWPELAFTYTAPRDGALVLRDAGGITFVVRRSCDDPLTEILCDAAGAYDTEPVRMRAGETIAILIEGPGHLGTAIFQAQLLPLLAEGAACRPSIASACAFGLSCVLAPGSARGTCLAACGDGIVDAGEQCDDANVDAGDGCAPDCALEP